MNLKNYSLAVAALLFFINGACVAQSALPQLPDTPAANQAKGWLEVFNAGDVEKRRALPPKNYPSRLERFDRETEMRRGTGGFDVMKVAESTPTKIVLLIQERLGEQFAQFTVEVEPAPPHAIKQIQFQVLPRPAEFAIRHLNDNELVTSLQKWLDEVADLFSGAVLVAKDGKTVFAQAYGLADREKKTPNTLKTRFRLGSMNKMFTAVATLQLVQNGKTRSEAPFGNYLTDYPNKDVASKVTIEQMLSHTGGTGDIFCPEFDKNRLQLKTLQDYVKLYGNRGPEFEPAVAGSTATTVFFLLGVIVERVSGQNYYDYVRDHIFKPAGMIATASEPEDQVVADRSVGYMRSDGTGCSATLTRFPIAGLLRVAVIRRLRIY
jgi:D-alanyl-D-alanine carboxypeptidase